VLSLYDSLLTISDNVIVRLNRIVAVAEITGCDAALDELAALEPELLADFLPFRAVRADLLRRSGRTSEARRDYDAALALKPGPAETAWLLRQRESV
jgi:RNA polymerase sigma-70 factor (ECF subfamily)